MNKAIDHSVTFELLLRYCYDWDLTVIYWNKEMVEDAQRILSWCSDKILHYLVQIFKSQTNYSSWLRNFSKGTPVSNYRYQHSNRHGLATRSVVVPFQNIAHFFSKDKFCMKTGNLIVKISAKFGLQCFSCWICFAFPLPNL